MLVIHSTSILTISHVLLFTWQRNTNNNNDDDDDGNDDDDLYSAVSTKYPTALYNI